MQALRRPGDDLMDEAARTELAGMLGPWLKPSGIPGPAWEQIEACIDGIAGAPSAPPEPMSDEDRAEARRIFQGEHPTRQQCEHCGGIHARSCPRIKSEHIVYSYNVTDNSERVAETEIKYWPPGTWETDDITFPEDVFD
jgi:hypothetical protein